MTDAQDVDAATAIEHAPHIGMHDVLISGLVLIPATGGDALGECAKLDKTDFAGKPIFGGANGVYDDVHAIPVQQVDNLADDGDGQISQPVAELVGLEPSTHEIGALKPEVDHAARTFVAVATPIRRGTGGNNGDVSPER